MLFGRADADIVNSKYIQNVHEEYGIIAVIQVIWPNVKVFAIKDHVLK